MRILNAIHAQSVGGVDEMFKNYTIALKKLGFEVGLLVSDNGNGDYDCVERVFRLKNYSQIFDFLHLLWILLRFRPKIVICHSNRVMKWMKIVKKILPVKSVAVNHGISFKNSLYCDYVVNINEQIHRMVVDAGFDEGKSCVIDNVIEVKNDYLAKKINKKCPVIAMYGRIEPRKGFDILLQAAKNLQQDFRLKIGGFEVAGGYNLDTIKGVARDCGVYEKCDFVGLVTDKDDFFADVDIFVVPSREEPFGLVILEGFSYSILVISSNSVGGKMLIDDGRDGLLFANEDSDDLARKIEFALQNSELCVEMTGCAYKKLRDNYNFSLFSKKIGDFLQKIH